jgi:hypothetical protein
MNTGYNRGVYPFQGDASNPQITWFQLNSFNPGSSGLTTWTTTCGKFNFRKAVFRFAPSSTMQRWLPSR